MALEIPTKKSLGSLIEGHEGQKLDLSKLEGVRISRKERKRKQSDRKVEYEQRLLRNKEHLIPDAATDLELERSLKKIATRGVVTLFNAVAKQQITKQKQEEEIGSSIAKRSKAAEVSKENFLTMLKSAGKKTSMDESRSRGRSSKMEEAITADSHNAQLQNSEWGVFDDNFAMKQDSENEYEHEAEYE